MRGKLLFPGKTINLRFEFFAVFKGTQVSVRVKEFRYCTPGVLLVVDFNVLSSQLVREYFYVGYIHAQTGSYPPAFRLVFSSIIVKFNHQVGTSESKTG